MDLATEPMPSVPVFLSSEGAMASWVVGELCAQVGVRFAAGPGWADAPVILDVDGLGFDVAIALVADQLGLVAEWEAGILRLVKASDAERGYAIVMPGGFGPERISQFVKEVGGDGVEVTLVGDRLFVSGPLSKVAAISAMSDLFAYGPDAWVIEVRAVELSEAFSRRLGLSWAVGGRLALGIGSDSVGLLPGVPLTGAAASALIEVVAAAESQQRDAAVYAQGLLHVMEGVSARMMRGDRVPIPERRVSDQGNVTITGYSFIETGFRVDVTARRVEGGVFLDLTPEISSISGFVEEVPIVAQSSVTASVFARSGEWVVLSGLESSRRSESVTGLPGLLRMGPLSDSSRVDERTSVLLFVRATRVYAGEIPSRDSAGGEGVHP